MDNNNNVEEAEEKRMPESDEGVAEQAKEPAQTPELLLRLPTTGQYDWT